MKKINIITIIGLGIIAIGVFLIYKKMQEKKNAKIPTGTSGSGTSGTGSGTSGTGSNLNLGGMNGGSTTPEIILDKTKVLKYGVTGNEVKALQNYLNKNYNARLVVDGIFGELTQKALQDYKGRSQVTLLTLGIININGDINLISSGVFSSWGF